MHLGDSLNGTNEVSLAQYFVEIAGYLLGPIDSSLLGNIGVRARSNHCFTFAARHRKVVLLATRSIAAYQCVHAAPHFVGLMTTLLIFGVLLVFYDHIIDSIRLQFAQLRSNIFGLLGSLFERFIVLLNKDLMSLKFFCCHHL